MKRWVLGIFVAGAIALGPIGPTLADDEPPAASEDPGAGGDNKDSGKNKGKGKDKSKDGNKSESSASAGVVSSTTSGGVQPVNTSFDVKVEGKGVTVTPKIGK